MFYWIIKKVFGPIVRLVWIKKVEGLENIPKKGAFIVAANHSSYFDFISLISVLPRRIYFLAAEKFYKSAFWHPLVAGTGQIKVDRESPDKKEVYEKVFSILKRGEVLGIFPGGTRSADGKIGKTFTGVAKFALQAHVPVVPCGIAGAYEVLPRQDKHPKLKKIIKIKIGKPIDFEEYRNKSNDDIILRWVTDRIMAEIKKLDGGT
jgi:1-acyl-sn-glycerol-3-phosphate acyltransferase